MIKLKHDIFYSAKCKKIINNSHNLLKLKSYLTTSLAVFHTNVVIPIKIRSEIISTVGFKRL